METLRIRVCTWNFGNASPPDNIGEWLFGKSEVGKHDIIVIGAQEGKYSHHGLRDSSSSSSSSSSASSSSSSSSSQAEEIDGPRSLQPALGYNRQPRNFRISGLSPVRNTGARNGSAVLPDMNRDAEATGKKKGLVRRAFRSMKRSKLKSIKKKVLKMRKLKREQCPSTSSNASEDEDGPPEPGNELQQSLLDRCRLTSAISCDTANNRTISTSQNPGFSPGERSPLISEGEIRHSRQSSIDRTPRSNVELLSHPLSPTSSNPIQSQHSSEQASNVRNASSDSSQDQLNPIVGSGGSYFSLFSPSCNLENDISKVLSCDYNIIARRSLGQITIFVCILGRHLDRIRNLSVMSKATGPAGYVNKGAVGVALGFDGTTFCFVNSHLPAHEGEKYRHARNADVRRIMRSFERQCPDANGTIIPFSNRFDHCFWLGDLNYRLEFSSGIPVAKVWKQSDRFNYAYNIIRTKPCQDLLEYDELQNEMKRQRTFAGFSEGDLTFAPTFKVLRGSRLKELASESACSSINNDETDFNWKCIQYNRQRVPAFCDRVLWKSGSMHWSHITNREYGMVESITTSDHKPVFSDFDVVVPKQLSSTLTGQVDHPNIAVILKFNKIEMIKGRSQADGDAINNFNILDDSRLDQNQNRGDRFDETKQDSCVSDDNTSDTSSLNDSDSDGSDVGWMDRLKRLGSVSARSIILTFGGKALCANMGPRLLRMDYTPSNQTYSLDRKPTVRLKTVNSLGQFNFSYLFFCFHEGRRRTSSVCVVELRKLLGRDANHVVPQISLNAPLTRYGREVGSVSLDIELIIKKGIIS